jgi:hypothetical protein
MVWDFHGFPVFEVQMFFVWLTSQHDFLDSLVKVQFLSILLTHRIHGAGIYANMTGVY